MTAQPNSMDRAMVFENGNLVKLYGMRPEYMDGHDLIRMVRKLAGTAHALRYQLLEVTGAVEEYAEMPCGSLRQRMIEASRRAIIAMEKEIVGYDRA